MDYAQLPTDLCHLAELTKSGRNAPCNPGGNPEIPGRGARGFVMTSRTIVTRFALLTCSTLGCAAMAAPAQAQIEPEGIPTGAPRSPLLNGATPFSQKLLLFEELGAKAAPDRCYGAHAARARRLQCLAGQRRARQLPQEAVCRRHRASQPTTQDQNPWRVKINACLGYGLIQEPDRGPAAGSIFRPPALGRILPRRLCPDRNRGRPQQYRPARPGAAARLCGRHRIRAGRAIL